MLRLLEPIGLVAMAGIVIPVVVHLWNDRRGRVLRIGSVALLEGASNRMAWRRRITQWWLLLLRCLILLALAFLLAGPYWQRQARGKGWVLSDGGGPYQAMIDSLVKAGYERHVLNDTLNYWAGFRAADREAPAGLSFYVFTSGLVGRFAGMRPVTARDVHWHTYAPEDSVERWVQRAWALPGDSMRVLSGLSRATGTSWERRTTALSGPVDTAVLRYRAYGSDSKYINAAMKALERVTGRPILEGDGGWLFWLSRKPLPPVAGYSHVWTYGWGSGEHVDSLVWREQAWNGRLPLLLGDLLGVDTPLKDRRMIDPRQVTPEHREEARGVVVLESVDLRPAVWVIVFLLFFLERIKAFDDGRKKA
jgi:Aerotolerance regulator N-terminal